MQKTQTICLILLATVAVGFSLSFLKTVILPFIIALFIVIGCRPVIEYLETRLQLHRWVAFFVAFLIGVSVFVAFLFLAWISINDLSRHSGAYETRIKRIATWTAARFSKEADPEKGLQPDSPVDDLSLDDPSLSQDPDLLQVAQDPAETVQQFFQFLTSAAQNQVLRLAGSLSSLLSYSILILIFVFFLLLGNGDMGVREPAHGVTNRGTNPPMIVTAVEEQIRKYLVVKTAISLLTGLVFGATLWMFGVPLAIVFGFLAFLLNYIPNLGPLISSLLPVPFLVLNSGMSITAAVACFILILSIQFISGNVIEQRVMGKSFDVSPVVLLLGLMFFGLVWGIVGMFLATPIISIIKIVLQQTRSGQPLAELMAGRWSFSEPQRG